MRSDRALEVRERVRWYDIDSAGIIYFGAYVRFSQDAETELYRALGFSPADFDRESVWLYRVHIDFNFFMPAVLDDELALRATVAGVGASSLRLHIEAQRLADEKLLAEATLVSACMDRQTRKSRALPAAFAAALREHLAG